MSEIDHCLECELPSCDEESPLCLYQIQPREVVVKKPPCYTREQNTEYHRKYREKNREKIRKYKREYMRRWYNTRREIEQL